MLNYSNKETIGLIYIQNKYDIKQQMTTTELQTPDLVQTHTGYCRLNKFEGTNPPLDNGSTQKKNL